ncbi:heme lyase CcmF/NrfE family subunit [Elioraea thermophila]|uniref:heme lyase CcmF/NrfE family subunit n=1 Tax=Elioraea thermophila TaxID=2185104 RepID=UPI000DF49561|nr:heme lyase CcmF/NrfE family subunit [Elioraea thermophila]
MIPELGHYALVLALMLAGVQAIVTFLGARLGEVRGAMLMAAGPSTAIAQAGFVALAFLCLMWSYAVSDFSVANVVQNSHSLKPMLYKLTGTWGNHEGSMVLWVFILALCGALVAVFGSNLPATLRARVLGVLALVSVGFLLFILFTSNPFERVWPIPEDGQDLNPLLQDPGLAFHPPFLYLGYVGTAVAFAFACAALLEGRVDAAWGRWVRPWTLFAWCALTVGIGLGSWWAYYELGWGGFWFWDPVENASLMPWFLATALLHSAIVVEKREALKVWTILLAILTFSLSLLGTFLVRSGILNSVHAFANDPDRGVFILALLFVTVGASLALYAWRAPALVPQGVFAPISREGSLILNNLLLATLCAVVFVGTLYPLFADLMWGAKITVGPPFFNAATFPLFFALLFAMGVGPLLPWKRGDLWAALARLKLAFGVVAVFVVVYLAAIDRTLLPLLGFALALWLVLAAATDFADRIRLGSVSFAESWRRARGLPRGIVGGIIAHAAVGITVAGIAGKGIAPERITLLQPGETTSIAGYVIRFEGTRPVSGPNWTGVEGRLVALSGDREVAVLTPQRRHYPVARMGTTEAAIRTTGFADLYAVIGETAENGATVVRLHFNPLAPWIWAGTILMSLGGVVSLTDRRLRVGVPARRRAPAAAAVAAE